MNDRTKGIIYVGEHVPESDYAEMPRQLHNSRDVALERGEKVTTTYTPEGDGYTEVVEWTNEDGEGCVWRQRWDCGLDNAPKIGEKFRILHDEWIANEDASQYLRIIRRFEVLA